MILKALKTQIGDPVAFIRRLGYSFERERNTGEISFARRTSGNAFPRFHIYYEERGGEVLIKLHLDQKAPSYGGTRAHAGEHEGAVIDQETKRIQDAIANVEAISK